MSIVTHLRRGMAERRAARRALLADLTIVILALDAVLLAGALLYGERWW